MAQTRAMQPSTFYLGSKLAEPEYVSIAVKNIPLETMIEFDLNQYADGGNVLFQVDGTMYGHPVAGRIATQTLSITSASTVIFKTLIYHHFLKMLLTT